MTKERLIYCNGSSTHGSWTCLEQPEPAKGLRQTSQASDDGNEGCIADGNLEPLPLAEDGGVGVKVVGCPLVLPARDIGNEIQRPANREHANDGEQADQSCLPDLIVL